MRLTSVVFAAVAVVPATTGRAPVTCRYRVEYRGSVVRIQVAHHSVSHETIPIHSAGVLTVQLTDSVPVRRLELVLDSLLVTRADGSPLPDAAGGAGSRWQGRVEPDGDVVGLTSPGLVPGVRPLDRFARFLFAPWKRADGSAGARVDTTAWVTNQNGETGSERVISTYAPPRVERSGGREHRVLTAAWTGSRSGTVPAGPERMTVSAAAAGRTEYAYVADDACPLAASWLGSTTQTRMAPAFPAPLTTTGGDSLTLTRLP
ncbi:MAG TPA: hypothetical protein VJQ44_18915 [Gemmatimonadales bacterium]|nr:hypothetical protein [Gemmatimonadales bacterium]